MDELTKFYQASTATDAFCADYEPIKARYFPALHFDWLIFKYGTKVATTMKSGTDLQSSNQITSFQFQCAMTMTEKVSRNFSLLLKFYFLIARWIFKLIFALRLIHEFD